MEPKKEDVVFEFFELSYRVMDSINDLMTRKKVTYKEIAEFIDDESEWLTPEIKERVGPFSFDKNLKSLISKLHDEVDKVDSKGNMDPHSANVFNKIVEETQTLINLCDTSDWSYGTAISAALARDTEAVSVHDLRKRIMQESESLYDMNLTTKRMNDHLIYNGQALARFAARNFRDLDGYPQVMEVGQKFMSACKDYERRMDAGLTV